MAVRTTEERLSETIADINGIIQSLDSDMQRTDDDITIMHLSRVMAKALSAIHDLTSARMCYRQIEFGEKSGGDADI